MTIQILVAWALHPSEHIQAVSANVSPCHNPKSVDTPPKDKGAIKAKQD